MIVSKKANWILIFIFFIGIFAHANEIVIGLEKAAVRKSPSFLSKPLGYLKYGASVKILRKKNSWYQISFKSKKAWLHKSSFSNAEFVLKDIGKGEQVSKSSYSDEVVTAGKGFNPEYEAMYKEKNPKLDFKIIDNLEKRKVSTKALRKFAKKGNLRSALMED